MNEKKKWLTVLLNSIFLAKINKILIKKFTFLLNGKPLLITKRGCNIKKIKSFQDFQELAININWDVPIWKSSLSHPIF